MLTPDQIQMIQNLKRLNQDPNVDELIKIIEQQEEVLSFYANPLNYEQYSIYEQTSPIEQDNGDRARLGLK